MRYENKQADEVDTLKTNSMTHKIDFSKGPVWKCIVAQAIPLTIAQLVQLLYNVVDRIYLGHMGEGNSIALTGVGLTFPIVTLIMAFTVSIMQTENLKAPSK